ncbi:hypothetical protein [Nocardia otitidiscaviarum]|uniref:hypothetical protein n=1 Tax=Nocardia otitidiscaviarum TaxID=1823 RepID=UPI002458B783|nr:hypothetical protein [Nocardia otitidiscaviarum]
MDRRRAHRRRRVEKDAAANLSAAELYTVAAQRYGWLSPKRGAQQLESQCAQLVQMVTDSTGATASNFLRIVAQDLWADEAERPDLEALACTMYQIAQRPRKNESLIWCDSHGWLEPYSFGECAECPCRLPTYFPNPSLDAGGRPRRYCSNACRQRAYRKRRKADRVEGV